MSPINTARVAEIAAYECYLATLVGDPAPVVKQLGERMRAPQSGDIVLECSTIYDTTRVGTRLGRLARVAQEPICSPEEWDDENHPVPLERVYYIELADGREHRWVNASFVAIPEEIGSFTRRAPTGSETDSNG